MRTIRYEHGTTGEPFVITIARLSDRGGTHFRVQTGALKEEVDFHSPQPGRGWYLHHGRVVAFDSVATEHGVEVWIAGRRVRLTEVRQGARRAVSEQACGPVDQLAAPMPGTVLKINLGVGEAFAAHQPLIVMESMKMELTLSSPHAGKIAEIRCRVGELVAMGAVMAKLEAS